MSVLGNEKFLNQFKQTSSRGTLDVIGLNNVISGVVINDDEAQITSAGDLVVVRDGANGVPCFREVLDADTNAELAKKLKGFVVKNLKKACNVNDDVVGVALQGSVMRMIAGADLESGNKVAYDVATGKIVVNPDTASDGVVPCGFLLDTAKAEQVVRVYIQF